MTNSTLPPLVLHSRRAGSYALQALTGQESARVIGSTSRGLFLLLPENRVIFLSIEDYPGPLTVTLERAHPRLRAVQTGAEAVLHPGHLEIPDAGLTVDWSRAETWTTPASPERILPREQRLERLKAIVREVLGGEEPAGIAPVCAPLLGMNFPQELSPENQAFLEAALAARQALSNQDLEASLAALKPLLGLGRGLTPSGDDFVEGLLLTLARFRAAYQPFQQLEALSQSLIKTGYTQTTALSANLIEMAAKGEADERLIWGVDGLMAGAGEVEECARDLLAYGSTSGTDALVGMVVAGSM